MPGQGRTATACLCRALGAAFWLVLFLATPASAQWFPFNSFSDIADMASAQGRMDMRFVAIATITTALATLLLVLCAVFIMAGRRASREIGRRKQESAQLRAELDVADALIEARDALSIVWLPAGPQLAGNLSSKGGIPVDIRALLAFRQWLATESADLVSEKLAGLIERGEVFRCEVRTRGGEYLDALGRVSAGYAILTFARLGGDTLDAAKLRQQLSDMEHERNALQALLEAAAQPAWARDAAGRIEWANQAYADAAGLERPVDVIAQNSELVDDAGKRAIARHLAEGDIYRGRAQRMAGNGTYEIVATRLGDRSLGLARDITEVESVRDEMTKLVESHTRTLDRLDTAIAVFGSNRRLRFFNAAYAKLWQLDETWLRAGPSAVEIMDALRNAGRLQEHRDYRHWRASQLDLFVGAGEREQLWHLPDGRSIRIIAEPDQKGGLTLLCDNMTERLRLESRHKAFVSVQRETLDNLNEGVALFSSDGRLRLYNPAFAAMWRLSTKQLDAEPHVDQIIAMSRVLMADSSVWSELKSRLTALDMDRRPASLRFERVDGSVIDCTSVPMPGGGTLVTYMDVTDAALAEKALVERNEALEAADKVKSTFIRHVSYVLRAPLTTIIGYTDLIARDPDRTLTAKQREFAEHVLTSSHALLAIINDILDLATIDAGAMELVLAPVDVSTTMHAAAEGLRDQLREANNELIIEEPEGIDGFIADDKRLRQILFNLISNAITFSEPGGKITVGGKKLDGMVHLSVSDNGSGVPANQIDQIFERFESNATASGQRGAGLGLSIVKSLVELHGGEVRFDSAPGKGTTVTCVFPALPSEAARRRPKLVETSVSAEESLRNSVDKAQ